MSLKNYFKRTELWLDDIDLELATCFTIALKNPNSRFRTLHLGSSMQAGPMTIVTNALTNPCCNIKKITVPSMTREIYQLLWTALSQVPGKYQLCFLTEQPEWQAKFSLISSAYKDDQLKRNLFSKSAHPIFPGPLPLSSFGKKFPHTPHWIISPFTHIAGYRSSQT